MPFQLCEKILSMDKSQIDQSTDEPVIYFNVGQNALMLFTWVYSGQYYYSLTSVQAEIQKCCASE